MNAQDSQVRRQEKGSKHENPETFISQWVVL